MDIAERKKSKPPGHISSDGDIVLVVGQQETRLRVHSQCLRSASKVFSAMFGPHWNEGQEMSSQCPREVFLVEDNPDAMYVICSILHHCNTNVPEALVAEEVLQIAIAADKYDLSVALKFARAQWLKPRGDEDVVNMAYLMAAAFLFDDTDAVAARSLDLVTRYEETYLTLMDDENVSQIIPWRIFYQMEERRTQMRTEASHLIWKWANSDCSCGWRKNHCEQYALLQSEYRPLKMIEVPILEVIDKMKAVTTEDTNRKRRCKQYGGYYHETPPYKDTLLGKLESMGRKASTCLDCIRTSIRSESRRSQHV
ncbi:hypothetical protein BKA56DRAFT_526386 [Ilyonectria sp. MPI-CAGE-AT-0026]|nr:hypothetical protein BKA56DRAFT_526386 [Ilyonectria sp. MPI-CAGE-AT-0026]